MSNKRKRNDLILNLLTYIASSIGFIVLILIFIFVLRNGASLIDIDLITGDFHPVVYNGGIDEVNQFSNTAYTPKDEEEFYSEKWGIALKNDTDLQGYDQIVITYIAKDSPLNKLYDINDNHYTDFGLKEGMVVSFLRFQDLQTASTSLGAEFMISQLDSTNQFKEIDFRTQGGGIRGSLLTTLYAIGITLLIALPIGIFTAIYLSEYAHKSKITRVIRSMIEMLTGVPSIIFGLMGLAVFVPLTVSITRAENANILSGSLTLAVIILPVIIRSTEESLKVVPDDFRQASLALGANRTQTTFKVVLPSALAGILTSTLLAIGRIIGESAALIFAIGAIIRDDISIFGRSTTLAVHIYSLLTDEPANIALASTIALIILVIVLILNLSVKLISSRYTKKFSR
jgi:phosphate transport system permease protein